ncbi:MAG: flagellar hook-associated protein FlgK [Syntrophaceticus sp.]|nr:flagellar hook-associated protein FlgK [Syntrophaceticus sp.]HBG22173.1 flagellar hook-associated protein FlgK [Peptococcaceae bacterium]
MSNFGLYVAMTGLFAQKKCIDVTAHNIANASTPGYTRQRAELSTKDPWPVPGLNMPREAGQLGTGVQVKTIERIRDQFLDQQIRQQTLLEGEWEERNNALSQVETIFMELSDNGLNSVMDKFWDDWNQLSKFPDSSPVRTTVVESSVTLADTIRHTYSQLKTLQNDLNEQVRIKVDQTNSILNQIADLNKQIQTVSVSGLSPNDLLDRRDILLDQLNSTVAAEVHIQGDQTVNVMIGGMNVVDGFKATLLTTEADAQGIYQVGVDLGKGNNALVQWSDLGGEFQGLAEARDNDVEGYMEALDQLAVSLAREVNKLHMDGYGLDGETGITGIPFFVGSESASEPDIVSSASSIYINPYLTADPQRIAAAASPGEDGKPASGNGNNALLIYQLRDQKIEIENAAGEVVSTATINDFYKSMISKLGVDADQAENMVINQEALVTQLNNRKESISGVSLDEEMTNMIQYQNAYMAAAKLVNVIDEMTRVLINLGKE